MSPPDFGEAFFRSDNAPRSPFFLGERLIQSCYSTTARTDFSSSFSGRGRLCFNTSGAAPLAWWWVPLQGECADVPEENRTWDGLGRTGCGLRLLDHPRRSSSTAAGKKMAQQQGDARSRSLGRSPAAGSDRPPGNHSVPFRYRLPLWGDLSRWENRCDGPGRIAPHFLGRCHGGGGGQGAAPGKDTSRCHPLPDLFPTASYWASLRGPDHPVGDPARGKLSALPRSDHFIPHVVFSPDGNSWLRSIRKNMTRILSRTACGPADGGRCHHSLGPGDRQGTPPPAGTSTSLGPDLLPR